MFLASESVLNRSLEDSGGRALFRGEGDGDHNTSDDLANDSLQSINLSKISLNASGDDAVAADSHRSTDEHQGNYYFLHCVLMFGVSHDLLDFFCSSHAAPRLCRR